VSPEYANTSTGDVDCWGLSASQAARYHDRLSRMHAGHAARFAALAVKYSRQTDRIALIGGGIALLFVLSVIGAGIGVMIS
jgi:hypothetical protein